MTKERKNEEIKASMLSFSRLLSPSFGVLSSLRWGDDTATPLLVKEQTVRGVMGQRLKKKGKDSLKIDAKITNANIQKIDSVNLLPRQDTLRLDFTLLVTGPLGVPHSCNSPDVPPQLARMVESFSDSHLVKVLAIRYAENIANARYLWRNRLMAQGMRVSVRNEALDQYLVFDPRLFSLAHPGQSDNENVATLAEWIETALIEGESLLLEVEADARIGTGQTVYPSQEMIMNHGKMAKNKTLYRVQGDIAAMHSQKIGNALRTIDTWYDDGASPAISVEPYGSLTFVPQAMRPPAGKRDFYTLFDKWVNKGEISQEDQCFVMACLVRGGVYGA